MIIHYIKFAIRNFRANKIIFFGSLLTLCLGTLCIALMFSYVPNELNMDGFHKRKNDIYLLAMKRTPQSLPKIFDGNVFAKINYQEYPELESVVSIGKYPKGELKLTHDKITFSPEGLEADSTFFQVFDFKLKLGAVNALADPDAILLTEKLSKSMFGEDDPIGKVIYVKSRKGKDFTVKGIIENPPQNSSIEFDFVFSSYNSDPNMFSMMNGDFILVSNNFNKDAFEKKIKFMAREHISFTESTLGLIPFDQEEIQKENLNSIYIFSRSADKKNLYMQIVIMLVILVVSALNFSNLQIISTNIRVKGNALKRINGALKGHLINQLLVELALLVGISTVIVTAAFQLVLPTFNSYIQLNYSPPLWQIASVNAVILFVIALLGLIYPLFASMKSSILNGLKNKGFTGNQIAGRKAVVVFQYALTFLLIISSITIVRQLQLMLDKDLGFKENNIITSAIFSEDDSESREEYYERVEMFQFLKNEMAKHTSFKNFAQGRSPINAKLMEWRRKDGEHGYENQNTLITTPNYEKVLDLELVEGRFFDDKRDKSRGNRVVINEAAKRYWDIQDISTTRILNRSWNTDGGYEIIGVVKDFNYEHLSAKPNPLFMLYMKNLEDPFLIEFEDGSANEGLAYVAGLFKKQNPKEAFSYTFLSDEIDKMYQKEKQLGVNVVLFSIIALAISVIGLFTIAIYDTQRRTKEIAIRKVNGAKVSEVLSMLNKSFIKWVAMAFVIACPIGYFLMNNWLKNFAYKTNLSWWTFALTGIGTLAIALLTVSWQSYKAATTNPVESLRME